MNARTRPRKSSASNPSGNCVWVALDRPGGTVVVTNPEGSPGSSARYTPAGWRALLTRIKDEPTDNPWSGWVSREDWLAFYLGVLDGEFDLDPAGCLPPVLHDKPGEAYGPSRIDARKSTHG